MLKLALAIFLSLCGVAAAQLAGGLQFPGPGTAHSSLVGPPTFTYRDLQNGSTSTNTATSAALAIGTASATRRVYILAAEAGTGTLPATSASFNAGAIAADVFQVLGNYATNEMSVYLISAVVPTGTTCTVTLTFPTDTFSSPRYASYTVDTTTLSAIAPVTTASNTVTGATANPTTTNTFGIAVATAGSAILAGGFFGFGGGNNDEAITSSDAPLTQDATGGAQLFGHANGVAVTASSRANVVWTGSGSSVFSMAVFR